MIFVLLLLIDQALKLLTLSSGLALINKGIAFGLFSSFNILNFLIFTCIFLFFLALRSPKIRKGEVGIFPLKLILVGGLSNLLDRVIHGGVVDYIFFPIIPSFNLADLAITLGFLILVKKILAPAKVG